MAVGDVRAFLLGLEGVALLRALVDGTDASHLDARLGEIRDLLDVDLGPFNDRITFGTTSTARGYDVWASSYDDGSNPLLHAEQPTVEAMLERLLPGKALDVACGTGRITQLLHDRGHEVIGLDGSRGMLGRAAEMGRPLVQADLLGLPFPDESFDLVTCCLALTHTARLDAPMAEFARVLRPGGHLLTSDIHVASIHLGGTVSVEIDGEYQRLPTGRFLASDYLNAAWTAGLTAVGCEEPRWGPMPGEGGPLAAAHCPDAAAAAYRDTPSVIAWLFQRPA